MTGAFDDGAQAHDRRTWLADTDAGPRVHFDFRVPRA
jgi:hypothetical protein